MCMRQRADFAVDETDLVVLAASEAQLGLDGSLAHHGVLYFMSP